MDWGKIAVTVKIGTNCGRSPSLKCTLTSLWHVLEPGPLQEDWTATPTEYVGKCRFSSGNPLKERNQVFHLIARHIFPKSKATSNKNSPNFRHHFLAQKFMPFHIVWSIFCCRFGEFWPVKESGWFLRQTTLQTKLTTPCERACLTVSYNFFSEVVLCWEFFRGHLCP